MSDFTATLTDWKDQYRILLRETEETEEAWRASEELLRRAARQIAIAGMGQSALLDQSLERVVDALRSDLDRAELQAALKELTDSLHQLPRNPAASAADTEIALVMRELVTSVSEAPVFRDAATPLAESMEKALADNDWVGLARALAGTVAGVATAIEQQREELAVLIQEVARQLEQFEDWTAWQREASEARRQDSSSLETTVEEQMQGIGSDFAAGNDVSELKRRVQMRLESVATRLREFCEAETERESEAEARTAALHAEISILRRHTQDLAQAIESKEEQLLHDSLTGLHSRYAYERRFDEEFHRWQRHPAPLAFALWDIDRFKRINDAFGHAAGDKLLKLIGRIMLESKREEDFVARIGGEEFVLLLPSTDVTQARTLAERIRDRIAMTPFHYRGAPERVTISCGLTEFRPGDTQENIYERADRALYRAKQAGRNCCIQS